MHKVIKPFSASVRYGNDHYFDPLKNHLAIIYKSLIDLNPNFSATNIKKLSKTLATYVELCYTMLRIMLVKLYLEVLVLRKILGAIFFKYLSIVLESILVFLLTASYIVLLLHIGCWNKASNIYMLFLVFRISFIIVLYCRSLIFI